MTELMFARAQIALSLIFHIVFAAVGIAMPLMMVIAEARYRKTADPEWMKLARAWAKGTAVLFAVGAVSGTVLSFELGLLFPRFMQHAGPLIGMPFSFEGFAFFTEAIFLGIYLYGWDRVRPRLHLLAGVVVAVSGAASAAFVTIVNAWMNAPRGFRFVGGRFVEIDPIAAAASPFLWHEIPHALLAAYMATGFAVAAIHAKGLLKDRGSTLDRKALAIALVVAIPSALLQPAIGHFAGQQVAHHQPLKLAAMEGLVKTQTYAPLHVGPIPIPGGLSLLAFDDPAAKVTGLDAFPVSDWPHPLVRWAFQIMVLLAGACALHALYALVHFWRKRSFPDAAWFLRATLMLGPAGMIALEAGWVVTELGRQPWVVYNVLRTAETVTPMTGLWVPFTTFALVYLALAAIVIVILRRHVHAASESGT